MTGTLVCVTSRPFASATKVFALTTSSVLTPNILKTRERREQGERERLIVLIRNTPQGYQFCFEASLRVCFIKTYKPLSARASIKPHTYSMM